ncbi:MAG: hypothetical protein AB9897_04875 [Anaerolineaceae bacterium]
MKVKMNLKDRIKRINLPLNFWTVGGASLILVVLCYGLLTPFLRYYLDDWPQFYSMKLYGLEGFKQYNLYDGRPFGYWPAYLYYQLFGENAILWHLNIYLLRWLGAMFMWATFIQVWPKQKVAVSWAAILFAVFPLFTQLSMVVGYSEHFTCFLLYFLSTFLMVLALRKRKFFWLLMPLAVLIDIVNVFTIEYFIGIEFLRPLLIWVILREEGKPKAIFGKVIVNSLPYLVSSIAFIVYRLFLIELPKRTNLTFLGEMVKTPFASIVLLIQNTLRDFIQILLVTWRNAFNPTLINFSVPVSNIAWIVAFLAGAVFLVFVYVTRKQSDGEETGNTQFVKQAFLIGSLGIILGCAPGWSIGKTVSDTSGIANDRFAIAAMFSAAIVIVAFFSWLFKKYPWRNAVILTFLVAIAAGQNFRVTNDYRWSSIYQNRFAYQLTWRAPSIKAPTAIFADNEMFIKMGVYPTSFFLNLLYPNRQEFPYMDYWFYTLNKYFPKNSADLPKNIDVDQGHWYAIFHTKTDNSLVISWHPLDSQCLWVLTKNDRYNPRITDLTKQALGATHLDRISTTTTPGYPDVALFGKENTSQWCYYFEKGDFARQLGNWSDAIALYETATAKGFETKQGVELMPFIEAYAHQGNGEKALALTNTAATINENMREYVCDNWIRIYNEVDHTDSVNSAYQTIYSKYACAVIGQ